MIRKSLYVRIVAMFILAVILGVIGAFNYMSLVYKDRIIDSLYVEMEGYARDIASVYEMFDTEQADRYIKTKHYNKTFLVSIYDSDAKPTSYGNAGDRSGRLADEATVRSILGGERYRDSDFAAGRAEVGIPFQLNGRQAAMIVLLVDQNWQATGQKIIVQDMGVVLLIGSLFVTAAATFLVRPLKGMKEAAERIARGEFDIDLKWTNRKDEIGELARSFSHMAREVKQMEQMRQAFVSNVSHEIQSPLTSISGFSKTLQRSDLPEETRQRYLRIIHAESERLSRLGDSLLQLASLDSEHHPFSPVRYDVAEQLREVVLACEPQWSAKSLELRFPHAGKFDLYADPDQMSQVWLNIIGNSIKFTPEGGSISIAVKEHAGRIDVSISDNGEGIREEEQERIFERFYKADQSRSKKMPGSGLGLAIVKKIVLLHGGTVQARLRPKGGTVVTVSLPSPPKELRAKI